MEDSRIGCVLFFRIIKNHTVTPVKYLRRIIWRTLSATIDGIHLEHFNALLEKGKREWKQRNHNVLLWYYSSVHIGLHK